MLDLIVLVPDHCFSFYFLYSPGKDMTKNQIAELIHANTRHLCNVASMFMEHKTLTRRCINVR